MHTYHAVPYGHYCQLSWNGRGRQLLCDCPTINSSAWCLPHQPSHSVTVDVARVICVTAVFDGSRRHYYHQYHHTCPPSMLEIIQKKQCNTW